MTPGESMAVAMNPWGWRSAASAGDAV